MAPNWPVPAASAASRKTPTLVNPGAICFSSSSHFAAIPYSNRMKPVALPPGRARLSTKPAPTGSATPANTIGMVRVSLSNDARAGVELARMTSGASATNSVADFRMRSASPSPKRVSICTLRLSVQPNCSKCARKVVKRACASGSSAAIAISTQIRLARSGCCARPASGNYQMIAGRSDDCCIAIASSGSTTVVQRRSRT